MHFESQLTGVSRLASCSTGLRGWCVQGLISRLQPSLCVCVCVFVHIVCARERERLLHLGSGHFFSKDPYSNSRLFLPLQDCIIS